MTVKIKQEQTTVDRAYVHCDFKGCVWFVPSTGLSNSIDWLTCVKMNEKQARELDMYKTMGISTPYYFTDKITQHLCPEHASLFEEFVNSKGKDGTV